MFIIWITITALFTTCYSCMWRNLTTFVHLISQWTQRKVSWLKILCFSFFLWYLLVLKLLHLIHVRHTPNNLYVCLIICMAGILKLIEVTSLSLLITEGVAVFHRIMCRSGVHFCFLLLLLVCSGWTVVDCWAVKRDVSASKTLIASKYPEL